MKSVESSNHRQISIELLRILAILMVLGLHANFMALGVPSNEEVLSGEGLLRIMLQSLSIVAVNLFVMISGWFGIKPSLKGFCNLIWQIAYCIGLILVISYIFFNQTLTLKDSLQMLGLLGGGGWFVGAYLGLYILSPMINAYIQSTPTKQIFSTLLAFFAFEFIWGNSLSVPYVLGGYSAFSFIGIYALAGWLKKIKLQYQKKRYLMIFGGCMLINTIVYSAAVIYNQLILRDILLNYINPLVILGGAALLLYFANLSVNIKPQLQKFILWTASSAFAAYLLHAGTSYVQNQFCERARIIYISHTPILSLILIALYILLIFFSAVIIDQPRHWIWKKLINPHFSKDPTSNG